MNNIYLFLIWSILLSIGVYSLYKSKLSAKAFNSYLIIICFFGLAFYTSDRLIEVSFKDISLILERAEKVKEKIFAKEQELRKTSVAIAKLSSFMAAMNLRIGEKEDYALRREFVRKNSESLLNSLNVSEEEKREAFEILNLTEQLEKAQEDGNMDEFNRLRQVISEEMKKYINSN